MGRDAASRRVDQENITRKPESRKEDPPTTDDPPTTEDKVSGIVFQHSPHLIMP